MDAFEIRRQLIKDYSNYVRSFINIRDRQIDQRVQEELDSGLLWPDPLIQLNPAFEPGDSIDGLVAEGILHEECCRIFKKDKESGSNNSGRPLHLYRHQSEAIRCAAQGRNYVLTTGTASGKSLSYIVPIVNQILRRGSGGGIQALIIYPMNALANSQFGELKKFLHYGYPESRPPVKFAQYTGQEKDEQRKAIIANPPDILITNYVMAELILTRPDERQLVEAARGLQFLVMDELHTYRGRQGADVALLIRRWRDRVGGDSPQYVGTSATMASGGNFEQQRREVASIATKFFGATVLPDSVIGETLRPATKPVPMDDPGFLAVLRRRVESDDALPSQYEQFVADPLSSWIEHRLGLTVEDGTGRLIRAVPRSLTGEDGAAAKLADETGLSPVQRVSLAAARSARDEILGDVAVLEGDVRRLDGTSALHQEQVRALRGERANLDAAEIKARLGPVCPVCNVPIDLALAEGCGISGLLPDASTVTREKRSVADQMRDCNTAIAACETDMAARRMDLATLRTRQSDLEDRIEALETEIDRVSRQNRQRWAGKQRVIENVGELQQNYDDVAQARRDSGELAAEDDRLRDRQAELRASHQDVLKRFDELFGYVCRGVLGNDISASVSLTGLGIQADVQVGGMAMESLKAIAFDLAATLMSIEGRTVVPAFLVHDSPREADLGVSIYHRWFRFIASLESLSAEPPFQYIITTTSEPPAELRSSGFVVETLHGAQPAERLLRRELR